MFWNKKAPIDTQIEDNLEDVIKKYKEKQKNYNAKTLYKLYSVAKRKHLLDFKAWKYGITQQFNPMSSVLIHMQLTNGQHAQFITKITNNGFVFDKGFYIVDDNLKYYDVSAKLWCFDYHEELVFPIKRTIHIKELTKTIIHSNDIELDTAINPVSLQKFMESTVIQKLLSGAEMEDALRFLKTMVILTVIMSAVILLININKLGII